MSLFKFMRGAADLSENNKKNHSSFFSNTSCEHFPCHPDVDVEDFNCLFCYCPLYPLGENCGGIFSMTSKGAKNCIDCPFPHNRKNYELVMEKLKLFYGM